MEVGDGKESGSWNGFWVGVCEIALWYFGGWVGVGMGMGVWWKCVMEVCNGSM